MQMLEFNDKFGNRSLRHQNLVAARLPDGRQVIFTFTGKSVAGVVQVIKEEYNKNGKWSATYWQVELADGVIGFVRSQDWETGQWLNSKRWHEAIVEFRGKDDLDDESIERFIRAEWKRTAERLDAEREASQQDGSVALMELLAAQDALAEAQAELASIQMDVARMEATELVRAETIATSERVSQAKVAMAKGASLADLTALLG